MSKYQTDSLSIERELLTDTVWEIWPKFWLILAYYFMYTSLYIHWQDKNYSTTYCFCNVFVFMLLTASNFDMWQICDSNSIGFETDI